MNTNTYLAIFFAFAGGALWDAANMFAKLERYVTSAMLRGEACIAVLLALGFILLSLAPIYAPR